MKLVLRNKALEELKDAYLWYEDQKEGLGEEFLNIVHIYLETIQEHPEIFKITYKNLREVFIKKFPYMIIYLVDKTKKEIVVVSIFHTSRDRRKKYK